MGNYTDQGTSDIAFVIGAVGASHTFRRGFFVGAFSAALISPTSKDQCMHGGWTDYPQFKNQGDCVSFVATGGKHQPT